MHSNECKIFTKYCNTSKTVGKGSPSTTPPPPLYHDGGMTLRVRPRVKCAFSYSTVGVFLRRFACVLKRASLVWSLGLIRSAAYVRQYKCINREGLGRGRTETRQAPFC